MASTLLCIFLESVSHGRRLDARSTDTLSTMEVVMETTGNIARASLAALLFIGAWGTNSNAVGAESNATGAKGILLKQEYVPDSYCHQKLPAITEATLAGDHPVVSQSDVIDFYGPCNQNPLGKEQVQDQRIRSVDRKSH